MKDSKLITNYHTHRTEVGSVLAEKPEFTDINSVDQSEMSNAKPEDLIIIKDDSPNKSQNTKLGIIACSVFGVA